MFRDDVCNALKRLKTDGKPGLDSKQAFRNEYLGARKLEAHRKSDENVLHAKHSSSLWSVPSIYVDNVDSKLNENVEHTRRCSSFENIKLDDIEKLIDSQPHDQQKAASSKKFIHSIQEKLHHLTENIKNSPPKEHGKMFHDLKENVSGKIHQIAEKMHNFHFPHSPGHGDDSLVKQAMQAMLMEKFNIVEGTATISSATETSARRKSSSSSLQSMKEKFNVFQRPRRSLEAPLETESLKSISEDFCKGASAEATANNESGHVDASSLCELNVHNDADSDASVESVVSVLQNNKPLVSKDDLQLSVDHFDSFLSAHKTLSKASPLGDTNKTPLHDSLLSLNHRNELSTSPATKMHARTESIGCKFPASPSKNVSGSLGKDSNLSAVHRRSSDSDLSVTPKGEYHSKNIFTKTPCRPTTNSVH